MSSLILPSRRIVQPAGLVEIDWSNPLTRGLVGAFLPNVPLNICDGVGLSQFGSFAYGARAGGIAITSGALCYPAPVNSTSPEALKFDLASGTAFVLASQDSNNNSNYSFFRGNGSSTPSWYVGLHSGSYNGALIGWGSFNYSPTGTGVTTAIPRSVAVTAANGNAIGYFDGVAIASGSYTGPTYQYDAANYRRVFFGAVNGVFTSETVRPFVGYFWNRALSDTEIKLISDNPWQIFKPVTRRIYFDVGAGGGLSVNATQATADASGNTATVDRQLAITASQAAASASGYAAGISFGLTVSAAQATADASGYLAGIDRHLDVVATTGTASASGYDVSIQFGNDLNIVASYGLASADGYQAAVNLQAAINATAATASASGYDAAIVSGGLSLTAADLAAIDALIAARISDIAAATLAAATAAGGIDANMTHTNGTGLKGDGTEANKFRSVLVA